MLSKVTRQYTARQLAKSVRCFGSGSGKWYQANAENGLQKTLVEQAKEGGHHDHHVHTAPLDHKFIEAGANKKTIVFDNLRGSSNAKVVMDNEFAHLNGLSMFQ